MRKCKKICCVLLLVLFPKRNNSRFPSTSKNRRRSLARSRSRWEFSIDAAKFLEARGIALRAIQVPKSYRPLLARRGERRVYPRHQYFLVQYSLPLPSLPLRPSRSLRCEPPFSFLSSLHRPARFQQAELPVYQASRRFPRPRARARPSFLQAAIRPETP